MELPAPSDRVEKANRIFIEALALPPEEREQFVREQCAQDEGMHLSVLGLLSQYGRLGDFLEGPAFAPDTPVSEFHLGEVIGGRFHILESLGRGGMGEVYRAEDRQLREVVALKTLRPRWRGEASYVNRFRDEIRLARKIAHPNVCRIFDLFIEERRGDKTLYFTMEFVGGENLAQRLKSGRMETEQVLEIARQIAAGLGAAHNMGIVHRDLKPGNILLAQGKDRPGRVVITDFGLAKAFNAAEQTETVTGQIVGTPEYMAPEQLMGNRVTPATDVFALGIIVYEMASGRRPFPAEDALRLAIRRITEPAEPLSGHAPGVPRHWTAAVARALDPSPGKRYQSAVEFVEALEPESANSLSLLIRQATMSRRTAVITSVGGFGAVASVIWFLRLNRWGLIKLPKKPLIMLTALSDSAGGQSSGHRVSRTVDVLFVEQLQQSKHVRILSQDSIHAGWQRIAGGAKPLPEALPARTARDIALREGAEFVVFGNLSQVGGEPVVQLRLEWLGHDPSSARRSWSKDFPVRGETDLPSAAFDGAAWIRESAGESAGEVETSDRRPEDLTTPSWQALQEYSQANDAWLAGQHEAAILHLKTALGLDPGFARASARLADILAALGRRDESLPYYSAAAEGIRQRDLTDRESLTISGLFALDTGQYAGADDIFSRYALEYPDEALPLFYKASAVSRLGQNKVALELSQRAIALQPQSYVFLMQRAVYLLDAGGADEAAATCERGAKLKSTDWTDQLRSGLAFGRLDFKGAWDSLEHMRLAGSQQYQSRAYGFEACFRAEQGRWQDAERLLRDGLMFDERMGLGGQQVFAKHRLLTQLFLRQGRKADAGEWARKALERKPGHENTMQIGCLLAQQGDIRGAQRCLLPGLPEWPAYQHWRQRLQGEILLAQGDARGGLRAMQAAPPALIKNQWPEHLVRAAIAARDPENVVREVTELFANPARFWVQADSTGPGFFSWAARLAGEYRISETEAARAGRLRAGLDKIQ